MAVQLERPTDLLQDSIGGSLRILGPDDVLDQHREFVAAQPGRRVTCAQRAADALRDCNQELVAHAMAERVVDDLEVVEIDKQD